MMSFVVVLNRALSCESVVEVVPSCRLLESATAKVAEELVSLSQAHWAPVVLLGSGEVVAKAY